MPNLLSTRKPFAFLLLFLLSASFTTTLFAGPGQKKPAPGSVFISDKGKFKILLDGKTVGHEEFEIVPSSGNWIAKGTTHLSPEGSPSATVTGNLLLQPDGVPISYEWTSQTDKTNTAKILFTGGVAKMNIQMQGAHPFQQDLTFNSPLISVLDINLYHQYAVLARIYDWSRRGSQTFPVLIPQQLLPGSITVDGAGSVSADGKSYEGLKVITSDLEVILYLDSEHRLMRIEVPSVNAAIVRE